MVFFLVRLRRARASLRLMMPRFMSPWGRAHVELGPELLVGVAGDFADEEVFAAWE